MDTERGNQTLLDVTKKYQNIPSGNLQIPVPYFINTAEQEYKLAMREAGVEENLVKRVIQLIKEGKTLLGRSGGKGLPEEIAVDLDRLMKHLNNKGVYLRDSIIIRKWMVEVHIGLDCSGYVYNVLLSIENDQNINILDKLAWSDPKNQKSSHAGTFVFDSAKLISVSNLSGLTPLDIVINKSRTHVGIIAKQKDSLYLSDCSMEKDGITLNKINRDEKGLIVENHEVWTELFKTGQVIVKRIE